MRNENARKPDFFSANIPDFAYNLGSSEIAVVFNKPLKFQSQMVKTRGLTYDESTGIISGLKPDTKYKVDINVNVRNHPVNYGYMWYLYNGASSADDGGVLYPQCAVLGYPNSLNGNYLASANVTCTIDPAFITTPSPKNLQLQLINGSPYTQSAYLGTSLFIEEILE